MAFGPSNVKDMPLNNGSAFIASESIVETRKEAIKLRISDDDAFTFHTLWSKPESYTRTY